MYSFFDQGGVQITSGQICKNNTKEEKNKINVLQLRNEENFIE